jgi:xanthine dehydrogenase accessory factor
MDDIYEAIAGLRRRGEQAVLATVVRATGSVPRKAGAKMLVTADGRIVGTVGGGWVEHQAYEAALKLIGGDEPQLAHFELTNEDASKAGMLCGGTMDVYLEPIKPVSSLLIFGGGHISFSLARLAKMLAYRVTVIDDRPEYANAERFPDADETIAEDFTSAIRRLTVNSSSYIVIVTRGHQSDGMVLEWAARTPAAYVGMIGSKRKVQTIFAHLKSQGITQEQLARIHAPIGLSIGAETPEEIAVSIMAEIIQVRRQEPVAKTATLGKH